MTELTPAPLLLCGPGLSAAETAVALMTIRRRTPRLRTLVAQSGPAVGRHGSVGCWAVASRAAVRTAARSRPSRRRPAGGIRAGLSARLRRFRELRGASIGRCGVDGAGAALASVDCAAGMSSRAVKMTQPMTTDDAAKRSTRQEWRRRWLDLPRDARREVTKAVHEGRAVNYPELAPMAVDVAAIRLGWKDGPRWERNVARNQRRIAWCYAGLALPVLVLR